MFKKGGIFGKNGPIDKVTKKMDKNVTKWVEKNMGDSGEVEVAAAEQARQQAEAARAQAQAEQQAAAQREATARAQQEAATAEASRLKAEAADLQAQLDAANARTSAAQEARKVAELKAKLAQIQHAEQAAAVAGAENAEQLERREAAQSQDEDDPILALAIAESKSSASQASAPPSYEEIEAMNASALEEGIRFSKVKAQSGSAVSSENRQLTEEQDQDLAAGIKSSLSEVITEQCKALATKLLNNNVLPQNVKLTNQQYKELQQCLFQKHKFQSSNPADEPVERLQGFADEWLNQIEHNIVASEADSNLSLLAGLSSHLE